ncbi:hypothetical protein PLESTM_000762000 [Pleodorina starrii]|nr:hypothetical protein PLESTM_000762000 [Pleodorina starrii]
MVLVAKDLAELQAAVGQQLHPLEQLGAPYPRRQGPSARCSSPPHPTIGSNPLLGELPPDITLQHLFSRHRRSAFRPHSAAVLAMAGQPQRGGVPAGNRRGAGGGAGGGAAVAEGVYGGGEACGEALVVMRRMCAAAGAPVAA